MGPQFMKLVSGRSVGTSNEREHHCSGCLLSSDSVHNKVHERHGERSFAAGVAIEVADLERGNMWVVTKISKH